MSNMIARFQKVPGPHGSVEEFLVEDVALVIEAMDAGGFVHMSSSLWERIRDGATLQFSNLKSEGQLLREIKNK